MSLETIAAQLRKGYEPYFLVECDFDGYLDRIAARPVSIPNSTGSDPFFDGKLMGAVSYGATYNFDNMSFSIGSISVTRNNADRFQDQETIRRLDGAKVTVYIWCEGLTWQDINPYGIIMIGTFEKQSHDKYEYKFSINDISKSDKYGKVPKLTINDDTWPLHRKDGGAGSVSGKFVPLVFGDFPRGVSALCVNWTGPGYYYIVTSGISKSVEANFVAGTENVYNSDGTVINEGNYTLDHTVDELGNPCTIINFIGNYASQEPISCSIQGITDGSGEYTGTAGTLLEHPSDIVRYLIDNFGSRAMDYVDYETFNTLKSLYPGLKFAVSINDQVSLDEIISNILNEVGCCSTARIGGYHGIFMIDPNRGPSCRLIQKHVQLGREATFKKTPERSICNRLIVQYGLNHSTGAYEKELTLTKDNNSTCKQSYLQYGSEFEKTIQLDYVHDETTAAFAATNYMQVFAYRHDLVEWTIPMFDGLTIRRGDVGLLTIEEGPSKDGNGWTEEPCVLIEKKYRKNQITQLWWRIAS